MLNMMTPRNLLVYLAFNLTALTNELLQTDVWDLVWKHVINKHMNTVKNVVVIVKVWVNKLFNFTV
jgi:hypothetical protein